MVLLTMTPSMVEGLKRLQGDATSTENPKSAIAVVEGEPVLSSPNVTKPISHAQILRLSTALKALSEPETHATTTTLEALLVGARVYVPPPPPKPEPVCPSCPSLHCFAVLPAPFHFCKLPNSWPNHSVVP